jgi:hypothetical protein
VCISKIGNNNFYETKINHKVSYMLMHSCRCILFIVMTGFIPILKGFKNHLKLSLKNQIGKRKTPFLPPLPPFGPSGLARPAVFSPPARSPTSLSSPLLIFSWAAHFGLGNRPTPFPSSEPLTSQNRMSAPSPTSSRCASLAL